MSIHFREDTHFDDDLEMENKYDAEALGLSEDSSDDSDLLTIKSNKNLLAENKKVVGIDHEELRKKIESFSLKTNKKKSTAVDNNLLARSKSSIIKSNSSSKILARSSESLGWYMKVSRLPIFLITLYSILILFRSYLINISSSLTLIAKHMSWFDNLRFLFEILVFFFTAYVIIKKKKQLPRIAGIAGVIIGFSAGVIIAVIKLFWYREVWNIFYLSSESIYLSIIGLIISLISAAIFYETE